MIVTRQLHLQSHVTVHIDEQDLNIRCRHTKTDGYKHNCKTCVNKITLPF